ncbi:MAG: hypothetical protein IT383_24010 [Deltaproteobacteria bacterium]|nr:hypothetical protein [Deltaproteobacteria bacterium]
MSETVRELELRSIRAASVRSTVPLFRQSDFALEGSGVVVLCDERYFVLTAGHVVGAFAESGQKILIGPFLGKSQVLPDVVAGRALGVRDPVDAGVIELLPNNDKTARRLRKRALACDDLILVEPHCDGLDTTSATIVGCPGVRYDQRSDGHFHIEMFAYQSFFERRADDGHLVIIIDDNDAFDLDTGRAAELPSLKGASGGGVWVISEEPRARPCLVATHVGSEKERGEGLRFATAAPLRTHLRILHEHFGVPVAALAAVRRHRGAAPLTPAR